MDDLASYNLGGFKYGISVSYFLGYCPIMDYRDQMPPLVTTADTAAQVGYERFERTKCTFDIRF